MIIRLIFLILISSYSVNTYAKPGFGDNDPAFLISACRAVNLIYNAKDQKKWLASQTTSLSDALRAGYCLGVLEQFKCGWPRSQPGTLIEQAKRVAKLEPVEVKRHFFNIEKFLNENVCQ